MATLAPERPRLTYAQHRAHPSERVMDVALVTAALDQGKAALTAAIRREMERAVVPWLNGRRAPVALHVTPAMVAILVALYRFGWEESLRLIGRMGLRPVEPRRTFAAEDDAPLPVRGVAMRLGADLERLGDRITRDLRDVDAATLGVVPRMALDRLERVPGALNAASYLVIPPFNAGQEDVYRANAHLFGGFRYSAAMDRTTCDECASKDGREYASLDDAAKDGMDGFGPNPLCYGGTRCRCTLIPLPPETGVRTPTPGVGPVAPQDAAPAPAPASPAPRPSPTPPAPTGLPVRQALSFEGSTPEMARVVGAADEIQTALPGLRIPRTDPIPVRGMDSPVQHGHINALEYDDGHREVVNIGLNTRLNLRGQPHLLAHEFGHAIDYTTGLPLGHLRLTDHPAMAAWREAVEASEALAGWRRTLGPQQLAYVESTEELFARSFAQWATIRSPRESNLRSAWPRDRARAFLWGNEDFRPISRALTAAFKELGWLE